MTTTDLHLSLNADFPPLRCFARPLMHLLYFLIVLFAISFSASEKLCSVELRPGDWSELFSRFSFFCFMKVLGYCQGMLGMLSMCTVIHQSSQHMAGSGIKHRSIFLITNHNQVLLGWIHLLINTRGKQFGAPPGPQCICHYKIISSLGLLYNDLFINELNEKLNNICQPFGRL